MPPEATQIRDARQAFAEGDWQRACETFASARQSHTMAAEDLGQLAWSAFLVGREDLFVDALQEAHQLHVRESRLTDAVRSAFWLGFHLANRNETAAATGWFGRAARLLEECGEDCAERGYLLLPAAHQAFVSGRLDVACENATRAAAIAQRFGDHDLLALALHVKGRALLRQQRVADGLALLDEAMVAAVAGELLPQTTGLIYCSLIGACREVFDLGRAHEWTAALADWCERQPDMVPYSGECRAYRAELHQLHGNWSAAAAEASQAAARLERGFEPRARGFAAYQQGEVHRLRGEFASAENAYRIASQHGREPQPGLALLRLAQGDRSAAAASVRRALSETGGGLARARLLPASVDVLLANGALDEARVAAEELASVATVCGSESLQAMADQRSGAVALAEGRAVESLPLLRRAWQSWKHLNVPYEAARTRVLLGRACREFGDDDGADMEINAARAEFERLGAAPELAALSTFTPGAADPAHRLTPRQREVLSLLATGRTNRSIAEALSISEKTVARHVADVFLAIGVSTRAAATAYAYEHGLAGASG